MLDIRLWQKVHIFCSCTGEWQYLCEVVFGMLDSSPRGCSTVTVPPVRLDSELLRCTGLRQEMDLIVVCFVFNRAVEGSFLRLFISLGVTETKLSTYTLIMTDCMKWRVSRDAHRHSVGQWIPVLWWSLKIIIVPTSAWHRRTDKRKELRDQLTTWRKSSC
jgi:hypothetical protein